MSCQRDQKNAPPPGEHRGCSSRDDSLGNGSYDPGIQTAHHQGFVVDILHEPRRHLVTTVHPCAGIANPRLACPLLSGAGISD